MKERKSMVYALFCRPGVWNYFSQTKGRCSLHFMSFQHLYSVNDEAWSNQNFTSLGNVSRVLFTWIVDLGAELISSMVVGFMIAPTRVGDGTGINPEPDLVLEIVTNQTDPWTLFIRKMPEEVVHIAVADSCEVCTKVFTVYLKNRKTKLIIEQKI